MCGLSVVFPSLAGRVSTSLRYCTAKADDGAKSLYSKWIERHQVFFPSPTHASVPVNLNIAKCNPVLWKVSLRVMSDEGDSRS